LGHDLQNQRPDAICDLPPGSVSTNLIVNREKPPFDNPELRRAMALALDRQSFLDIITEGQGFKAAAMQPPPGGLWGMPKEMLEKLPGYGPDVEANRDAARAIMTKLGYGPDKHLAIKVSTRDVPPYRDPAVILIDQLKQVWIDGELEPIDTAQWYLRVQRKDYTVGLNLTGTLVDDPDAMLYENYACGGVRQLQRLLQSRDRQADRSAVDGAEPGQAPPTRLGDRAQADRGWRPAADLLQPRADLLGPGGQEPDDHGQQHL
jgi:peptide/nickel transport system substrate-binding protein